MEFKPGGVWRFVMHGPDGRDYENRITYEEIVRPERLVYRHDDGDDGGPVRFTTTVTFATEDGKTRVTLRAVFPTAAERDRVLKEHNAIEGGKQTPARLDQYVSEHKLKLQQAQAQQKQGDGPRTGGARNSMSLHLHFHPLSSFCQKVLVALYENDTAFEGHIVDLGNETQRTEFKTLWPIGKFPVLRDEATDSTVPELSIIIEYLSQHYPGEVELVPVDADRARQARMRDRFFQPHAEGPMQKIVADRLRPAGRTDPQGVDEASSVAWDGPQHDRQGYDGKDLGPGK